MSKAQLDRLISERGTAYTTMKEVLDGAEADGRSGLTAEERQKYDNAEKDYDAKSEDITRLERSLERAREINTVKVDPIVTPEGDEVREENNGEAQYRDAFTAYLRGGGSGLNQEQRTTLMQGASNDPEVRAQSVGTTTAGGYFVPPAFRNEFITVMKDFGSVQNVAQVVETETGANLQWPKMDDTSNVGAILAENTQMTEQDIALTTASLDAYVYTSKLTRASYQLIQDSAFDVAATVKAAHAERIARILNQHLTTGTGTAQPDGIVTSATSGVTAAGVAAITGDELISLVHSVDPAYRRSPRARFMLSDTALALVRKLKASGTGEYLWQPDLQSGTADRLLGYPVEINQDMAVPATGVKSVLFGDFYAGYIVRIVRDLQVITFTERYADYLQVAWSSYMRADGTLQNGSAYKALTQA